MRKWKPLCITTEVSGNSGRNIPDNEALEATFHFVQQIVLMGRDLKVVADSVTGADTKRMTKTTL